MNWKKGLKTTGIVCGIVASLATAGYFIPKLFHSSKEKTTASPLEQRITEKQEFYVKFGSPEKKYADAQETYGLGLSLMAALEKENGKKMTDADRLYFLATYVDANHKDGVSPTELSDYINSKEADGSEKKWAKGLKPAETKQTGFEYTFKVDYDPTQLSRLNEIIAKHAAIRHARYTTPEEKDMWRYDVMKFAAETFGNGYLNKEAVDKYEAHVKKVEAALK